MNWRAALPNALTLGNLACGAFVLLVLAPSSLASSFYMSMTKWSTPFLNLNGPTFWEHSTWILDVILALEPWYFIAAAAVFDLLDGWAARRLNVTSALGVQLDSFADLVSFGLASSCISVPFLFHATVGSGALWLLSDYNVLPVLAVLSLLVYVSCVSLRLARFNLHPSGTSYFEGLPSPAAGILLVTSAQFTTEEVNALFTATAILIPFALALAMVSRWPFLSFKGPASHKLALVAVFVTGALAAWLSGWQPWAVLATLALYALVSRLVIRFTPAPHAAQ